MEQRRLGTSGLVVSEICMGTMTFGLQADEATGFRVMDRAFEAGIDFYDTAEVYPVPPSAELAGDTEEIVGRWLKTKPRDGVIIATKIAGAAHGWFNPPIRNGKAALDRRHIRMAIEGSLRRLQTDYIVNGGPRQKAMAKRFVNPRSVESTERFMAIAAEAGIDPVTLAVAWSKQHDFVASTIVGVSCEEQLDSILAAAGLKLGQETLDAIDTVSREIPYPMG